MPRSTDNEEQHWRELLRRHSGAGVTASAAFKTELLAQLKARLAQTAPAKSAESDVFRAILSSSYRPVEARAEFQTRLLTNMKERQRTATEIRRSSRKRALFLSAFSSVAAAAAVAVVVWAGPFVPEREEAPLNLALPVVAAAIPAEPASAVLASAVLASAALASPDLAEAAAASSGAPEADRFNYSVAAAFQPSAEPLRVRGIRAVESSESSANDGWQGMDAGVFAPVAAGMAFRSRPGSAGHMGFDDGTIVTMNPGTRVEATADGLSVAEGFLLVSVPESAPSPFQLHFPERDVAIEPGTDLAVMVESPAGYAAGGAPAPLVMVVAGPDGAGGLALARGRQGAGPLFADHVYRLDNYVTPDLPGRVLCDAERQDLAALFTAEPVRGAESPRVLFAGGFGGTERSLGGAVAAASVAPAGFRKRGNGWVAESYLGGETVKIKYLSDDYFGLANERRDLARAMALGGEVVIDGGGGIFYEIYR